MSEFAAVNMKFCKELQEINVKEAKQHILEEQRETQDHVEVNKLP